MNGPGTIEVRDDHRADALRDVVETICLFGEFPQPSNRYSGSVPHFFRTAAPMRKFDLYDFVLENIDHGELVEFFCLAMTDYGGDFDHARLMWDKKLAAKLTAHLKDSPLVNEQATKIAEEEEYT